MTSFIDALETRLGSMHRYDAVRDAIYNAGLPLLEEDIERIYLDYESTGELPHELEIYLNNTHQTEI